MPSEAIEHIVQVKKNPQKHKTPPPKKKPNKQQPKKTQKNNQTKKPPPTQPLESVIAICFLDDYKLI